MAKLYLLLAIALVAIIGLAPKRPTILFAAPPTPSARVIAPCDSWQVDDLATVNLRGGPYGVICSPSLAHILSDSKER